MAETLTKQEVEERLSECQDMLKRVNQKLFDLIAESLRVSEEEEALRDTEAKLVEQLGKM